MESKDFEDIAMPLLSALGLELIKIIIRAFITGKISIDSLPFAEQLGINNQESAEAFLRDLKKNIIV